MRAKLSLTPGGISRHAPDPVEDNAYVFGELLGMNRQEMLDLQH